MGRPGKRAGGRGVHASFSPVLVFSVARLVRMPLPSQAGQVGQTRGAGGCICPNSVLFHFARDEMVDSPMDPFYNRRVEECPGSFLIYLSPKGADRGAKTTAPNDAGLRTKGRKEARAGRPAAIGWARSLCCLGTVWTAAKAGLGRRTSGTPFVTWRYLGMVGPLT